MLIAILAFVILVCVGELPKLSPRCLERGIAKREYKIEFARRGGRVKELERQIEMRDWYLEKAEWRQEWKERYPD